jgi:hypothetical protein
MPDQDVLLRLDSDEALVLFEWVARIAEDEAHGFQHPAERVALWGLQGALERALVEPLKPDYRELLDAARNRLAQAPDGGSPG